MSDVLLSRAQIEALIPHRDPFLLLDRVVLEDRGAQRLVAELDEEFRAHSHLTGPYGRRSGGGIGGAGSTGQSYKDLYGQIAANANAANGNALNDGGAAAGGHPGAGGAAGKHAASAGHAGEPTGVSFCFWPGSC